MLSYDSEPQTHFKIIEIFIPEDSSANGIGCVHLAEFMAGLLLVLALAQLLLIFELEFMSTARKKNIEYVHKSKMLKIKLNPLSCLPLTGEIVKSKKQSLMDFCIEVPNSLRLDSSLEFFLLLNE